MLMMYMLAIHVLFLIAVFVVVILQFVKIAKVLMELMLDLVHCVIHLIVCGAGVII